MKEGEENLVKASLAYSDPAAAILKRLWVYSYAILLVVFSILRRFEKTRSRAK
jgi:hypothetical protein